MKDSTINIHGGTGTQFIDSNKMLVLNAGLDTSEVKVQLFLSKLLLDHFGNFHSDRLWHHVPHSGDMIINMSLLIFDCIHFNDR